MLKKYLQVKHHTTSTSSALLVLRLVIGIAFIIHGSGKLPHPVSFMGADSAMPSFLQLLATISEFGGGIALALGIITPLACFGIACTMIFAITILITQFKAPFVDLTGGISFELPLTYFGVMLLFMIAGPGKFSLDRLLFGQRHALKS